jgi:hypothetical protein
MAEIGHTISETLAEDVTTSSSFTALGLSGEHDLLGSNLDGSSEYILIVRAGQGGDDTSKTESYMNVTENGVGALGESESRVQPRRSTPMSGLIYGFIDKVTTASSPNDYQIQAKSDGVMEAHVAGSWLAMIKLDDLSANDWKYNAVDTNDSSISTSWETGASVDITAGDWLIIATTRWLMQSASDRAKFRIDVDGTNRMETIHEGESTDETRCLMTATVYEAAGDVTASVEYSSNGTSPTLSSSRIFAIRLDAFEDHKFARFGKNSASQSVSIDAHDTDYVAEILTGASDTNGSSRDWAIFAGVTHDTGGNQARLMMAVDQNGTQIIGKTGTGGADQPEVVTHGAADEVTSVIFGQESSHSDGVNIGLSTIVSDHDSPGNGVIDEAFIAAFTWELVAASDAIDRASTRGVMRGVGRGVG